jgi:hypothetical protein
MASQKKQREYRVKPYPELHQEGIISIENLPPELQLKEGMIKGDFGIQVASDGRIWICINGISLIRFRRKLDGN